MSIFQILKAAWRNYVIFYFRLIFSILNIPAFIYDYLFTRVLTRQSYLFMFNNNIKGKLSKISSMLDIGVGTGLALHAICPKMPQMKIVGIDIDKNYIAKAKHILQSNPNVEIREQNLYDLASTNEKYDLIVFSSSFMLMPDREKALDTAKMLLNKNGRIIFLLTLYENKSRYKIIEKIKPSLKYYTTVDFGRLVYETEFVDLMKPNGLRITNKKRVYNRFNPLLRIFRFFCIECEVIA